MKRVMREGDFRSRRKELSNRKAAALLFTMFILTIVVLMVVNVLDTTTLELSALRNGMDYDRSLYLANAGIYEVAAQLEMDINWRGTITNGSYPDDDSYEAIAVDGVNATVEVTSTGVAGDISRTIEATIEL